MLILILPNKRQMSEHGDERGVLIFTSPYRGWSEKNIARLLRRVMSFSAPMVSRLRAVMASWLSGFSVVRDLLMSFSFSVDGFSKTRD
jgi:hypothetical protein